MGELGFETDSGLSLILAEVSMEATGATAGRNVGSYGRRPVRSWGTIRLGLGIPSP